MNEITSRNLLRLSLALSLPAFAVLAAIHVARADLKADLPTDYNSVAAGQKISAGSVKNLLDNLDQRIHSFEAPYCGVSGPTVGAVSGGKGYASAQALCQTAPGCGATAHVCTGSEVIRSLSNGQSLPTTGWVAGAYASPSGNDTAIANDCVGFTSPDATQYAEIYSHETGRLSGSKCDQSMPLLCCNLPPARRGQP